MSRSHPGQSNDYNRKLKIRDARKKQRNIHKTAKEMYRSIYSFDAEKKYNRNKLNKIKDQLTKCKID
jgi:hypothetical protein